LIQRNRAMSNQTVTIQRRTTRISPRSNQASRLRASAGWRRVVNSEFELRQLEELRNDLDQEFKSRAASAVTVASRHRVCGRNRT
jgi:hypothetical protein